MAGQEQIVVNPENEWRLRTDGVEGWAYDVRPGTSKKKYFIITCDAHLAAPTDLFKQRIDKKWHDLLPRMTIRDGQRFFKIEGIEKETLIIDTPMTGEDELRIKRGNGFLVIDSDDSKMDAERVRDLRLDGVDGELIFPNGQTLFVWASNNPEFIDAQCAVYNDWVIEACKPFKQHCNPVAIIGTQDLDLAVKEVQRAAKLGFRVLGLPCKPTYGPSDADHPNYNWPIYDRLWAAIQDADLAITYHVSTGKDPRGVKKAGGAVINYVVHALAPTIEPVVSMCASGAFERFPKLRVATIEANAGWVPWMLQAMDESYLKHHMWVSPRMKHLPSDYFRSNCYASLGEDKAAIKMAEEFGLENNLMWANDYPHHEGLWPHSAEAIERTFGNDLREDTRKKILGLNAAKVFRFDIPEEYRTGY